MCMIYKPFNHVNEIYQSFDVTGMEDIILISEYNFLQLPHSQVPYYLDLVSERIILKVGFALPDIIWTIFIFIETLLRMTEESCRTDLPKHYGNIKSIRRMSSIVWTIFIFIMSFRQMTEESHRIDQPKHCFKSKCIRRMSLKVWTSFPFIMTVFQMIEEGCRIDHFLLW